MPEPILSRTEPTTFTSFLTAYDAATSLIPADESAAPIQLLSGGATFVFVSSSLFPQRDSL